MSREAVTLLGTVYFRCRNLASLCKLAIYKSNFPAFRANISKNTLEAAQGTPTTTVRKRYPPLKVGFSREFAGLFQV